MCKTTLGLFLRLKTYVNSREVVKYIVELRKNVERNIALTAVELTISHILLRTAAHSTTNAIFTLPFRFQREGKCRKTSKIRDPTDSCRFIHFHRIQYHFSRISSVNIPSRANAICTRRFPFSTARFSWVCLLWTF